MCAPILQAGAQLSQGFSDASTAKANAKMAVLEGQSAMTAANSQAAQIRSQGERLLSSNIAAQAASGVDVGAGSAAEVNTETAKNIEKDALMAGYQGQLAYASKMYEARLQKRQAKAAMWNAGLSAGATILGGGSDMLKSSTAFLAGGG